MKIHVVYATTLFAMPIPTKSATYAVTNSVKFTANLAKHVRIADIGYALIALNTAPNARNRLACALSAFSKVLTYVPIVKKGIL